MNQTGKYIKHLRIDRGLTQDELAIKIPISRQSVSSWERGLSLPDPDVLIKLSQIFEVSVDDLLMGTSTNEKINPHTKVTLSLYHDIHRKRKIIEYLVGIILIFITLFLFSIIHYQNQNYKYNYISYEDGDLIIDQGSLIQGQDIS